MKILVLVKVVPDTWSERKIDLASGWVERGTADDVIDEIGERALEVALTYRDVHKDTEVVLVSMGPASIIKPLRKGLAMGATSAVHLVDDGLAGADLLATAAALAAVIRREGFDLVLTGNESTDGRGGLIPAMLAEHLGVPELTFLNSIEIAEDRVRGERRTESGTALISASTPVIASITERLPDARFPNFKGLMTAKKKPLVAVSLAELGLRADRPAASVVVSAKERPARTHGVKISDSGNAGNDIAEFLASNRLI
ncbi:electron transfer flavoprotein subunit beta/FixA family protein [Cryobacterium sp. TMS1-20-1]|uniref:electron transfer flavoprotein subunit beta/FixA family protein n=1 Tax=Cryobacterium sp. TMS1-20-1 TaxID=1259223 RepID=UPI00106B1540|nr:electron transfer flavoprotein subunit beta/FixA family protein [Cryobacterium sp. TMS1-20-1]TFC80550.1 electron transfer flavoprotein subunit beta/FixA family protein [Cryobacterium sp. TMS1-20-1]